MAYKTYQWKPQDNPLTVARRFNLTDTALLGANQGGYPFSTGQTIRIPNLPNNPPNTTPPPTPGKTGYLDQQLGAWWNNYVAPALKNAFTSQSGQPGRGYYRPQPGARSPVGPTTTYPSNMPRAEQLRQEPSATAMQTASTMGTQNASYRGGGTRWIGDPMSTEAVRNASGSSSRYSR